MTKDGKTKARGLDRAFAILDYLCQTGLSQRPIDIAEGMGAPKSSIYDLVALLVASNVLQKVDDDGRVFLGPKLNFWGTNYRKHFDLGGTVRQALEHITSCTRETSQLCTLDGDKYYVAMMNEGIRPFRISADIGERIPVPWTGSGRFLLAHLAHLSDEEILDFIPAADFNLPDGPGLSRKRFCIVFVRLVKRNSLILIVLRTILRIVLPRLSSPLTGSVDTRCASLLRRMMHVRIMKNIRMF